MEMMLNKIVPEVSVYGVNLKFLCFSSVKERKRYLRTLGSVNLKLKFELEIFQGSKGPWGSR